MQSSSPYIKILGPILEAKTRLHGSMVEKIFAYWEKPEQTKVSVNKFDLFVPNTLGGSRGSRYPRNICNFYTYLSLETVLSAFKLTQNCYVTMKIYFLWKLAILSQIRFPSLFYRHTVLERLSSKFNKIWIQVYLKNSNTSTL